MVVNSRNSQWCGDRSIMLTHPAIGENKNPASCRHRISRGATELVHGCFKSVSATVTCKECRNGYSAKFYIRHRIQRRHRELVQDWLSDVYLLRVVGALVQQIPLGTK